MQYAYEEPQELLKSKMEQFTFHFEEETQDTERRNLKSISKTVCVHLVRYKPSLQCFHELLLELTRVFLKPVFSDLVRNLVFSGMCDRAEVANVANKE